MELHGIEPWSGTSPHAAFRAVETFQPLCTLARSRTGHLSLGGTEPVSAGGGIDCIVVSFDGDTGIEPVSTGLQPAVYSTGPIPESDPSVNLSSRLQRECRAAEYGFPYLARFAVLLPGVEPGLRPSEGQQVPYQKQSVQGGIRTPSAEATGLQPAYLSQDCLHMGRLKGIEPSTDCLTNSLIDQSAQPPYPMRDSNPRLLFVRQPLSH